jgi:hypothetical protein
MLCRGFGISQYQVASASVSVGLSPGAASKYFLLPIFLSLQDRPDFSLFCKLEQFSWATLSFLWPVLQPAT